MPSWRVGGAETLVFGDAIEPLIASGAPSEADPRIAVEALRGVGIVPVLAADLIAPDQAIRTVLSGAWASSAEVELALRETGDVHRAVWIVETVGRNGFVRRSVDARTGRVLSDPPRVGSELPCAILLSRRWELVECDLPGWTRCIVGLPLSIELEPDPVAGDPCSVWRRVLGAPRTDVRAGAHTPSGKV